MELSPGRRYDFVLAEPENSPVAWNLSDEVLEGSLLEVDPHADIDCDGGHFWFDAAFPSGGIDGRATHDPDAIGLKLVDVDVATEFVLWLRRRVLPAGAAIAYKPYQAIEMDRRPDVLPDSEEPDAIREAMVSYLREVLTEYCDR
jgi:hypothetical protein